VPTKCSMQEGEFASGMRFTMRSSSHAYAVRYPSKQAASNFPFSFWVNVRFSVCLGRHSFKLTYVWHLDP
jgi:hypothetical protein